MKTLKIEELKSLKNKKVKFSYIDYDCGNIKESVLVKEVIYDESEMEGKILFDTTLGEACIPFYLYDEDGWILAGDDADELEYKIIE